jgi:exopolyphosphatase/pppGpp-phosphohydrolase
VLSAVIDALGAPSLRISPGGLREGILLEKFRSLDHPTRPKSARVSAGRERDLSL